MIMTKKLKKPRKVVGGARAGAGRPPATDPLTESVMVRLTPAERAERAVAAYAAGQKLSAWMRAVSAPPAITTAAIRAAADHGAITATERDLLLSSRD